MTLEIEKEIQNIEKPIFKGIPKGFGNFDKEIVIRRRPFRIERHSTKGESFDNAVLDRNHTFLMNRIHKVANNGFTGAVVQPKKRCFNGALFAYRTQELVHRRGDFETFFISNSKQIQYRC